jgi:hypothetical protein
MSKSLYIYKLPDPMPRAEWEWVSPRLAEDYLDGMGVNRNLKTWKIAQMAADMAAGRWVPTHQGIAFNQRGELIDGQNRMWAVIESGATVIMLVVRGLPDGAMPITDTGTPRSTNDSAKIAGIDWSTGKITSTAARMMFGATSPRSMRAPSRSEELEFIQEHEEALRFVSDVFSSHKRGVNQAGTRAAVGRAWYYVPEDTLRAFVSVLMNGYGQNGAGDSGALLLFSWLMRMADVNASGGSNAVDVYLKTQRAIKAFVDREELRALYAPKADLYPLP